jgi:CBS domain-containing protein
LVASVQDIDRPVLIPRRGCQETMGKGECIDCCMKHRVISGRPDMTVKEAALLMAKNNVGTLPVVDAESMLVGVTTMADVIQIFLPDFVSLLSNIEFVKDYGDLGTPTREDIERAESLSVTNIMVEPVAVEEDCALIRALSIMDKHRITDLIVVSDGKLVGLASRVDIGRAFLSSWLTA